MPMSADDDDQRNDHRHALPHGRLGFRLLGNSCGRILIRLRHGYFASVGAVELHLLLADGEIAAVQLLRHGVEAVR